MKKNLFFIILFLLSYFSFSQSTDLDREYFSYSYVALPSEPIVNDYQRTFLTNDDTVTIAGYSRVGNNASIEVDLSFNGTLVENFEIVKVKHEKKNKEGKVTSTRYSYKVKLNYRSTGEINVTNTLRGKTYTDKFNSSASYVKHSFDTYSKAQHFYDNNRLTLRDKYSNEHLKDMQEDARDYLNRTYGYPVRAANDYLWILGSKRHPEYTKHHNAFDQVSIAFLKMSYLESTAEIEEELQPVIAYFEDVITRYPGSKKKMRKVKYASYYNLAKIYYYLDKVGKVKEYAQKLIANDYNKKAGRRFLKDAERLEKRMLVNIVNSRHFDIMNAEHNQDTDEQNNGMDASDEIVAFLITKANDTIQASINSKNIDKIAYTANLKVNDGTGSFSIKNYKAQFCKTLALSNEEVYQVIEFDETNTSAFSTPQKFAKVLYESDKISLFLFNNNEFVLKLANNSKGISTMSSSFVFGFNNKLAKIAANCSTVLDKTNSKVYKNNTESLIEFCEDFSGCQ